PPARAEPAQGRDRCVREDGAGPRVTRHAPARVRGPSRVPHADPRVRQRERGIGAAPDRPVRPRALQPARDRREDEGGGDRRARRPPRRARGDCVIAPILRAIAFGGIATVALLVARTIEPGRHGLEDDMYVLVLGAFALLILGAELRRIIP